MYIIIGLCMIVHYIGDMWLLVEFQQYKWNGLL